MAATALTETDRTHLRRCVALAREAVAKGHQPFGSVLVSETGGILREDHNRTGDGDPTAHPELALAQWAALHLSSEERRAATVYTSGEHCAMCAAAHGWAGLGRIVYASSTSQLLGWLEDLGAAPPPFTPYRVADLMPDLPIAGPDPDLADEIASLHAQARGK